MQYNRSKSHKDSGVDNYYIFFFFFLFYNFVNRVIYQLFHVTSKRIDEYLPGAIFHPLDPQCRGIIFYLLFLINANKVILKKHVLCAGFPIKADIFKEIYNLKGAMDKF